MRQEIYFYNKEEEINEIHKSYSLKNLDCSPQIKELSAFKNELFNLLNILKFKIMQ